jgi:carbon-monoxide dehydrogenase medium subunit
MRTFDDIPCHFPQTLNEALEIQADPARRGQPLAGGTDLFVQWESGVLPMPARALHLFDLSELQGIGAEGDRIIIGASVTHMQIRSSSLVQKHLPSLAAAAATVGGCQIQCRGTLAGSIANASPAGDLTPSLLITGGDVVVASASGQRRIPLSAFYLGYRKIDLRPEELIVRFELPKLPPGEREGFRKLGPRAAQAISKVMGAWRGLRAGETVQSFAVALGSVAPTAVRLPAVEKWISGKKLTEETVAAAERLTAEAVKPISDIRSTAAYRKWVSGRLIRGFLEQLAASSDNSPAG